MAGNREIFQERMDAGYQAAWDQDWASAIRCFSEAVQEFPNDAEAHIQLGLALLKAERYEDALRVYGRAKQLAPGDPVPIERGAEIQELMGRLRDAAQQYMTVADIYLGQKDIDKAIRNWERATQLTPGLVSIHYKLAQAYERVGNRKRAIYQYLMVAYNFSRNKEADKATKAVERALNLGRRNSQALNMLRALQHGGEVPLPKLEEEKEETEAEQSWTTSTTHEERPGVGDADPRGPIGEAMVNALSSLATYVLEIGVLDAGGGDALRAMELQRQEQTEQAIAAYQRAEPRLRHPSLKMNLGALLFFNDQPAEAIKHLSEATADPNLSAGALHGLGHSHFILGEHRRASRYLIQSLQAVDTKLAADQVEIDELTEIYGRLLGALDHQPDEALGGINQRFIDLLRGKDWKRRIPELRRLLEEFMRENDEQGALDFIKDSGSDELPAKVALIDGYIRQGLLTLAMDEAHNAVSISPHYLPVHVRMAEIMMREGRLRQAIVKYNVVARTFMARGENDRAAAILAEVLEMAPLDISVRTNLISLLEGEDRKAEVLDQYIELAKTYNQLGNYDLAHKTFETAAQLAQETAAVTEKMVLIKHSLADMDQVRLNTGEAIRSYEEIIELSPEDERAYRMLVDLNYNLANQVDAIRYLDKLLGIYAKKRQISKIVQLLEDLVKMNPADTGLRSRLAAIYRQLGRKREAIEQLDALGELQLAAGMNSDACQTIKQIITLKPENLEEYQRLLAKLGC